MVTVTMMMKMTKVKTNMLLLLMMIMVNVIDKSWTMTLAIYDDNLEGKIILSNQDPQINKGAHWLL